MSDRGLILKQGYYLARCCLPRPDDAIAGYVNYEKSIIVHKASCSNLRKISAARRVLLFWDQILEEKNEKPDPDYFQLGNLDFRILQHHKVMGVDYSLMVAQMLKVEPGEVFEHHRKLRYLKLLERVKRVMIQYRKGIVDNKWIKHRNHTYYRITRKGERYLNFFMTRAKRGS